MRNAFQKKEIVPKTYFPIPLPLFSFLIVRKIFHVTFASKFSVTHSEKNLEVLNPYQKKSLAYR